MITPFVLVAVAGMSIWGGRLALREPPSWRRIMSLAAGVASILSAGFFYVLVQAYDSRPPGLILAAQNPLAGLGPWDSLALLFSLIAIIAAVLGAKRTRILLTAPGILMFCWTLLALVFWD